MPSWARCGLASAPRAPLSNPLPLPPALTWRRAAHAVRCAAQEHDDRRTVELFSCLTMESASILSASAILSLGGVATAPGVGPNHKAIWINAVIQARHYIKLN